VTKVDATLTDDGCKFIFYIPSIMYKFEIKTVLMTWMKTGFILRRPKNNNNIICIILTQGTRMCRVAKIGHLTTHGQLQNITVIVITYQCYKLPVNVENREN